MPWKYIQSNGNLIFGGKVVATGYSGFDAGKNNPAMQSVANVGPIPTGKYSIGLPYDSEAHGPVVMRLTPEDGTDTYGRGGFLIHGDSLQHTGSASHGCIILPRPTRMEIAASEDRELEVI
jgi:hypothetical protein